MALLLLLNIGLIVSCVSIKNIIKACMWIPMNGFSYIAMVFVVL